MAEACRSGLRSGTSRSPYHHASLREDTKDRRFEYRWALEDPRGY